MSGFDLGLEDAAARLKPFLSQRTVSVPPDREFEIKYLVPGGPAVLSDILASLPVLEFTHSHGVSRPNAELFLISPDCYFKPYALANFGIDTVDVNGFPTCKVHRNGHQLRQRFSVRAFLPDSHPSAFGINQVSVKDLLSNSRVTDRTEIEECVPDMHGAVPAFLKAAKPRLPGFFSDVAASRLCVSTAFMTARCEYLMGVSLASEGAIVVFEVCNDKIVNLSPDLNHITAPISYEWEPEAKGILFLKNHRVSHLDPSKSALPLFIKAERKLREIMTNRFGTKIVPATSSKLERAIRDSEIFCASVSGQFAQAALRQDSLPSLLSLCSNITMRHISQARKPRIREIARAHMSDAREIIHIPSRMRAVQFDVMGADTMSDVPPPPASLAAAPRMAHV